MTVLDSSPAHRRASVYGAAGRWAQWAAWEAVPGRGADVDDHGHAAAGRRVARHAYCEWPPCPDREHPSALFAEMPLAVMPFLMSVRGSRISARIAGGPEVSAPDLTVMADTADHVRPPCRSMLIPHQRAVRERGRENDPAVQVFRHPLANAETMRRAACEPASS